jgi:DNA polymerase III epsilon subunit family exonuclease
LKKPLILAPHSYQSFNITEEDSMLDFFLDNFYTSNGLLDTRIGELEFSVLDLETTGLYPYNGDRIVEIGIVRTKGGKIGDKYESMINPRIPIPEEVTKINHIDDSMVSDAPLIEDKIDEVLDFIKNSVIIGHNLTFDMSFLNYQLQKMQRDKIDLWLVDTLKVARNVLPDLERYSLAHITRELKVKNQDAHRALADCIATADIFSKLTKYLPGDASLKDLQAFKLA